MNVPIKTVAACLAAATLFTGASFLTGRLALRHAVRNVSEPAASVTRETVPPLLLIDPGHGGEDGGASAGDTLEKDLNLAVSGCLTDLCTLFGCETECTRTDDRLLYDRYHDLEDYRGRKKTFDLRNRLRMAEELHPALFLSIHMNQFPRPQYKGLQVHYSPNTDESRQAASLIQSYAKTFLMPDNNREIKKATQAIYILKRIKLPAVLVECGFLSNPDECAQLETPEYRRSLAAALCAAALEYLTASADSGM